MKKIITSIVFSFTFLFATTLLANTDLKGSNPLLNNNFSIKKKVQKKKLYLGESSDAFGTGKVAISGGYGFPNLGKAVLVALVSDSAINTKVTGLGPFHFRAEYGLSDGVGLALSVNYISCGVSYTELPNTYKFSRSSLSILARMNFHFGTTEKLDPYFGIGAGYKQATWKFSSTDPAYNGESVPGFNPFGFEATIGVRYYIIPGFGFYTELGIAKSVMQIGLVGAF